MENKFLYILDGKKPVLAPSVEAWSKWRHTADIHVKDEHLPGGVRVSTVFLCIDHGSFLSEDALFFETMIFGGERDGLQWRYSTWEEAEEGHQQAVKLVFEVTV